MSRHAYARSRDSAAVAVRTAVRGNLWQRKCACGGAAGLATECQDCSQKSKGTAPLTAANSPLGQALPIGRSIPGARHDAVDPRLTQPIAPGSGHDFSRVRVHSELHGAPKQSLSVNGPSARSAADHHGIFIDGPDKGTTPPPSTPKPAPKKAPAQAAAKCPTDVQVINLEQINDPQFGKNGMLTGIGAVALMEVSDASGKDWDGTLVKENVKQINNTCGDRARKVCSNVSGEDVDFKVGAETKVLGKKVTAFRNSFYDLHVFTHGVSVLHELGKSSCEVQCQQSYQCGGKQFGPEFIITYMTNKDTIAKTYDVTRITIKKEAKAAPKATPATP